MEHVTHFLSYFLHLDQHLQSLMAVYGTWTYAILFIIIFCETGLVVAPFLPGDSLLFAAGSLAALGSLNIHFLVFTLIIAAILGDSVNYWLGNRLNHHLIARPNSRFVKKKHLDQATLFYEKYGGKAVVLARFAPIIRTFVPFVAGIAAMQYRRFLFFNVIGALLWVTLLSYASFWFGNLPLIKNNFSLVIIAIIVISLLPALYEVIANRKE